VVPHGALGPARSETVNTLLAKPAEALRLTQKLLRHGTREEVLERFELENGHFSERLQSDEVKQVIAAFFEKRKS
jgi:enoyl-CoA hydratase/carnithine racemase